MSRIRIALTALSTLLLGLGYAASQYYAAFGDPVAYAHKVDEAPIRTLALLLLVAAVAFAFIRDKDPEA